MKAPDKIYLVQNTPNTNFIWDVEEWGDHRNIEYIRKDFLLEWANEMLEKPYDRTTESAFGHRFAKVLIDKINSL